MDKYKVTVGLFKEGPIMMRSEDIKYTRPKDKVEILISEQIYDELCGASIEQAGWLGGCYKDLFVN